MNDDYDDEEYDVTTQYYRDLARRRQAWREEEERREKAIREYGFDDPFLW